MFLFHGLIHLIFSIFYILLVLVLLSLFYHLFYELLMLNKFYFFKIYNLLYHSNLPLISNYLCKFKFLFLILLIHLNSRNFYENHKTLKLIQEFFLQLLSIWYQVFFKYEKKEKYYTQKLDYIFHCF